MIALRHITSASTCSFHVVSFAYISANAMTSSICTSVSNSVTTYLFLVEPVEDVSVGIGGFEGTSGTAKVSE